MIKHYIKLAHSQILNIANRPKIHQRYRSLLLVLRQPRRKLIKHLDFVLFVRDGCIVLHLICLVFVIAGGICRQTVFFAGGCGVGLKGVGLSLCLGRDIKIY